MKQLSIFAFVLIAGSLITSAAKSDGWSNFSVNCKPDPDANSATISGIFDSNGNGLISIELQNQGSSAPVYNVVNLQVANPMNFVCVGKYCDLAPFSTNKGNTGWTLGYFQPSADIDEIYLNNGVAGFTSWIDLHNGPGYLADCNPN